MKNDAPNTTFLGPGQLEDLRKTQDDLSYRSSGSTKDEMNRIGTCICVPEEDLRSRESLAKS